MATLQALAISGIRGYNPEKLQRIDFTHPLTLINGKNGSGKTTIIEALKYITTGVMPPSAKTQKSFVMDPSIAGSAQVKGDIRLRFRTAKNRVVIAKKVLLVSKTAKGLSNRAVQQSLKTKDEDGKQIQVSQRCADIEKQIPEMLGISKAVLDNIVFCHQDQSLWPFSDSSTLKGIFDQLFQTRKFTKIMENMREGIKDYQKQKIQLKSQLQYIQTSYYRTIQNRTDCLNDLIQIYETSQQIHKIQQKLKPIKQQLSTLVNKEEQKNQMIKEKGVLEYKVVYAAERMDKIQERVKVEGFKLEMKIDKVGKKGIEEGKHNIVDIQEEIAKIERQSRNLQIILQSIKDKQAKNKRKVQFEMQFSRIKQLMPELRKYSSEKPKQILKPIQQKLKQLKFSQKQLISIKQTLSKFNIPSQPPSTSATVSLQKLQQANQSQKQSLNALQTRIRAIYNNLYTPDIIQNNLHITNQSQSKRAEQKLAKLEAQLQLKKAQKKKYQGMKPRQKSIEMEIYEVQYAGIQLQKDILEYIKRKKQCGMCMKKLNDQDIEVVKTKIYKNIKRAQQKVQQLKRDHDPSTDIDPTPIILQIQSFIDTATRNVAKLQQQKQKYDKYRACQHQLQTNKQLNKLMQAIQFKSEMAKNQKSKQNKQKQKECTIEIFRQLVSQYKYLMISYKNLTIQLNRQKQQLKMLEQFKKQYKQKIQEKQKLQKQYIQLQKSIKDINIIENVYKKMQSLAQIMIRDLENGSSSEESMSQIENKLNFYDRQIIEKRRKKYQIQLNIEYAKLGEQRQELRNKLGEILQKLQKITTQKQQNNELQSTKNNLELQQAKLSSKVNLKSTLASKYLPQDTVYLQKLLRFNTINSLIADIHLSSKCMQRAINRIHHQKMDLINKILYDMWKQVYHAQDIQFIRINSIAEKKNNNGFGYSIMMRKNGQMLEMKGRCSMGQKVLASLVIRMALAQAFSASTHILTLDEPTTNLDRVHIENLAQSISSILSMEQNSRLQLIVISHDMEFIGLLKKHTNFYYEISRNQKNFSTIKKRQISELNQENNMPRLQAIHY